MTFGQRFLLSLFIVLAAIFGLSLCGYNYWEQTAQRESPLTFLLSSADSQPVELPVCMDEATREQIRAVLLEGLDNALRNHIEHVFEVWLKDDRGQPGRARTGVSQGIQAYLKARKGAADWAPPLCAG